jgi:hypothetical protein
MTQTKLPPKNPARFKPAEIGLQLGKDTGVRDLLCLHRSDQLDLGFEESMAPNRRIDRRQRGQKCLGPGCRRVVSRSSSRAGPAMLSGRSEQSKYLDVYRTAKLPSNNTAPERCYTLSVARTSCSRKATSRVRRSGGRSFGVREPDEAVN